MPSAQALILVGRGSVPVSDPGWPEGALAVANLPSRVNDDGRCIFHNMPPGEYRVTSRPNPGHASPTYPSEQFVVVLPSKATAVTLIYKRSTRLES